MLLVVVVYPAVLGAFLEQFVTAAEVQYSGCIHIYIYIYIYVCVYLHTHTHIHI